MGNCISKQFDSSHCLFLGDPSCPSATASVMEVPLISGGGMQDSTAQHCSAIPVGTAPSLAIQSPCQDCSLNLGCLRLCSFTHSKCWPQTGQACRTLRVYSFFHWAKSALLSWAGILLLGQNKINKPLSRFVLLSHLNLSWLIQLDFIHSFNHPKIYYAWLPLEWLVFLWLWLVRSLWKLSSAEEIKKK